MNPKQKLLIVVSVFTLCSFLFIFWFYNWVNEKSEKIKTVKPYTNQTEERYTVPELPDCPQGKVGPNCEYTDVKG
jgi:hypothetical protein